MKLQIVSIDNDGSVRLLAEGPFTSDSFPNGGDNPLHVLLGDGWSKHRLVLDLSKVEQIDSSAIGWLINCHSELSKSGGRMVLHSIQPRVHQMLRALKFEAMMPLLEDELTARAAISGTQA
jgi:hypothetical protein